jgi:hypothetical protein
MVFKQTSLQISKKVFACWFALGGEGKNAEPELKTEIEGYRFV